MAGASSSIASKGGPPITNSKPSIVMSTDHKTNTNTTSNATNLPNKGRSSPSIPVNSTSTSQPQRRPVRPASSDYLSDKATAALIRRTLCTRNQSDRGGNSPTPIHDLLPPLTSRNDVDLQLYALIAIILREFVQNWYNKITPDETFVAEILQIIAHCTRALEQRLRKVDLQSLLFDELPELLVAHIRAYRIATSPATRPPLKVDQHEIYHSLWPLPALSPVPRPGDQAKIQLQAGNESAYRQLLVQGVLALLLPTEDLENDCLTSLVEQILSELVIGNLVAAKLSEPWLVWEIIIILTKLGRKKDGSADGDNLSSKEAMAHESNDRLQPTLSRKRGWSFQQLFWSVVHWIFLMVGAVRFVFTTLALSPSLPPRAPGAGIRPTEVAYPDCQGNKEGKNDQVPYQGHALSTEPPGVPLIDFHIWRCIGLLLEVEARMPWLQGMLSMIQWLFLRGPGRLAAFNGSIDRLLSHYVHIHILNHDRLPPLLRAIRAAVFPNNAPGVSSLKPPSSDQELAALRRRCASAIWDLVPSKVVGELYYGALRWPRPPPSPFGGRALDVAGGIARVADKGEKPSATNGLGASNVGGSRGPTTTSTSGPDLGVVGENRNNEGEAELEEQEKEEILSQIEIGIVDLFSDAYYNKHFVYGILELILIRLVPELAERGVSELWEERLV
ncbi:PXA domain-containing protein [Xylariaceae sp. FL0594]|nr:PXA domain-containing protein [Xylariaceae sp. FL0594]